MKEQHRLDLSNGAAVLLKSVLMHPQALDTLKDKFAAGELLTGALDKLQVPETIKENWHAKPWDTIFISEPQREACKKAITYCAENGNIGAGGALNSLISQLGLI